MKKSILFSTLAFIAVTSMSSCKKNDTGGKAELHAMIYHGATPIVGTTTLYVTFDASAAPAEPTVGYDLKLFGAMDDNHVHVDELRPGNYYLYAMAYDSLAKKAVKGGAAVTVSFAERNDSKDVMIMVE